MDRWEYFTSMIMNICYDECPCWSWHQGYIFLLLTVEKSISAVRCCYYYDFCSSYCCYDCCSCYCSCGCCFAANFSVAGLKNSEAGATVEWEMKWFTIDRKTGRVDSYQDRMRYEQHLGGLLVRHFIIVSCVVDINLHWL